MLSRRELSEAQVRQRLTLRGHDAEAVAAALDRLRERRFVDDARVADAIARTETTLKRRGRARVRLALQQAGIDDATARRALDDVFGAIDGGALLEAALAKRLRGRARITDAKQFQRLYRYLVGQGFESGHVVTALKRRGGRHDPGEPG